MNIASRIIDSRQPNYLTSLGNWAKWRCTYDGGEAFRDTYLTTFSDRETSEDFEKRRNMTPIPAFAKTAINEVRNSIFQRMRDISRVGGSPQYKMAVEGNRLGVDRRGSTMNSFLGIKVLTELLIMGQCGIFVDAPALTGAETHADTLGVSPYLYHYAIEDIMSWSATNPENPSDFQAVLLRDTALTCDETTQLPYLVTQRFRRLWLEDGNVWIQFYDLDGLPIDRNGNVAGPTRLDLTRIPFILCNAGDSVIKDVCDHQIALLNLGSSDVNYALLANFPFYIEQRDLRAIGGHLKRAATDGTASSGGQASADEDIVVGSTRGRAYDKSMNAPAFINPSPEPLNASLALQDRLKRDIRELVNLAISALAVRASAESKNADNQGLEAGLSYVGFVLEGAERQIAEHWAAYEQRSVSQRDIAFINYPEVYSLKSDAQRIEEAKNLRELMNELPGRKVKRALAKGIVAALLGGKVNVADIAAINTEIDASNYTTSNPKTIIDAQVAGIIGNQVAGMALGFDANEYKKAEEDHASRLERIAESQQEAKSSAASDMGARGVPDLSADPNAASTEKKVSRDTTNKDNTTVPVRGEGK